MISKERKLLRSEYELGSTISFFVKPSHFPRFITSIFAYILLYYNNDILIRSVESSMISESPTTAAPDNDVYPICHCSY